MKKIWSIITNIGVELESNDASIQQIKLLNQYTVIVFFVFFINSINNFFNIQDFTTGYTLLILSSFFILTLVLKKLRRIKFLVFLVFILLFFTVFFYESYSGPESGIYLYYFPVMLSIPFIFDVNTDKIYIILLILSMIICILINNRTNYSLFTNHNLTPEIRRNTFFVSLSISITHAIVDLVFIIKKNQKLNELYKISKEKDHLLNEQQKQLKSFSKGQEIDTSKIQELTYLAIHDNPSFFSAFINLYPDFCPALLNLASLSISELELCAYTKLNFSTKDIAKYAFISVRAVEMRKYRIRKKLNFSSEKDLVTWMMKFN